MGEGGGGVGDGEVGGHVCDFVLIKSCEFLIWEQLFFSSSFFFLFHSEGKEGTGGGRKEEGGE